MPPEIQQGSIGDSFFGYGAPYARRGSASGYIELLIECRRGIECEPDVPISHHVNHSVSVPAADKDA